MDKKEVGKLLAIITATYPNVKLGGESEIKAVSWAWYELLSDLNFELAKSAVIRVLREQVIPSLPTPGKIRRAAVALCVKLPSETEALSELYTAVKFQNTQNEDGYYPGSFAGLKLLSPLVQKVAEALGWKTICDNDAPEVMRGLFRKLYVAEVDNTLNGFINAEIGDGKHLLALACATEVKEITTRKEYQPPVEQVAAAVGSEL